jgi:hypothetical protein
MRLAISAPANWKSKRDFSKPRLAFVIKDWFQTEPGTTRIGFANSHLWDLRHTPHPESHRLRSQIWLYTEHGFAMDTPRHVIGSTSGQSNAIHLNLAGKLQEMAHGHGTCFSTWLFWDSPNPSKPQWLRRLQKLLVLVVQAHHFVDILTRFESVGVQCVRLRTKPLEKCHLFVTSVNVLQSFRKFNFWVSKNLRCLYIRRLSWSPLRHVYHAYPSSVQGEVKGWCFAQNRSWPSLTNQS